MKEKQKLRFNYGITERQLINYVRTARSRKGSTGEILLQLLEMRLDNIVFRLGFASTIASARQLISHGHVLVNGSRLTIPSYLCQTQDSIGIKTKSRDFVKKAREKFVQSQPLSDLQSCMDVNMETYQATVKNPISRDAVGLSINELLVVEYYSRKV